MIEAGFEQPVPLDKLRRDIGRMNVGDVSLQAFGGPRNIAIRLPLPPGDDAAVQATVKRVQAEIAEEYPGVSFRRVESVSGKVRSEEHTSELQSLMRISYAVFCLKKKTTTPQHTTGSVIPTTPTK